MSCHPNTDLQTNLVHHPQTDIVTQRLICTKLLSKSRDISFHPNTDLHKTRFTIQRHIFVTQRLLYRDKLDSQSRDIHILSLKDWFVHKNDSQDPQTNLFITQILTCNTNLIHNSRCNPEERQYLQRNRPPHKFVKTLSSSGKEIEVYRGKPKLGFSVSRLTWSTY
jgi:hypothetical protein